MKQYVAEKEEVEETKKKKKKDGLDKKDGPIKSTVTKRDYGLTENAKVLME